MHERVDFRKALVSVRIIRTAAVDVLLLHRCNYSVWLRRVADRLVPAEIQQQTLRKSVRYAFRM